MSYVEVPDHIPAGSARVVTRKNGTQVVMIEREFYEKLMAEAGYELIKTAKLKDREPVPEEKDHV